MKTNINWSLLIRGTAAWGLIVTVLVSVPTFIICGVVITYASFYTR